ncbi:uncharacterized protein LOC141907741 [Tubulanus polymorphus]|uniref:uncharacterized protein LOC141907741 n=1 Tax=Tubulanus polymorphus TaxID=672921 RepID=UPI003DA2632E
MHFKCTQHGLRIPQNVVRLLLGILDPEGVKQRITKRLRRRLYENPGPNAIWNVDGYDKPKPFGFCVSGCIDGFSRLIIWLEVWTTNNDPRVICGYFLEAVESKDGCPSRLRADDGTENPFIQQMQIFLRNDHIDRYAGHHSYLRGKSTANQRMEIWWGILRKESVNFWLDLFKRLQDDGYHTGDFIDKNLLQFCFMHVIQHVHDQVVNVWNCNKIRKQRIDMPTGRPIMMYAHPELQRTPITRAVPFEFELFGGGT